MILIGIVAVAVILAVIAFSILGAMWFAWWLHPLYVGFQSLLGLPVLSYWQFMAVRWFFQILFPGRLTIPYKEENTEWWTPLLVVAFAPPLTYYLVLWALS